MSLKTCDRCDRELGAANRARTWYSSNTARAALSAKNWVEQNRLAVNAIQARRRAKKAAVLNTLTTEEWVQVLEYFNYCCAYCLRGDVKLTMDHMDPIAKGGSHTMGNIVPACKSCNCSKRDAPIFVMARRL